MSSGFGGAGNSASGFLEQEQRIQLADTSNDTLPSMSWCRFDTADQAPAELIVAGLSAGDHWGFHSQYFDRALHPPPMDLT